MDEAYLDVTGIAKSYADAVRLAERIKAEIYEKEKLTCSIGIGPSKLVAKIASDHRKPDGLTVVTPEEVEHFLAPLPVRKIPGIGPKSGELLKKLGITTIGELAGCDVQRLIPAFGRWAHRLVMLARGIDGREVRERSEVKSIGRERTFENDIEEEAELIAALEGIAERVHRDLEEEGFLFKTLTLKVRFADFETHTRARTLSSYHDDLATIKEVAKALLSGFLRGRKVRLLGIRLSKLKKRQTATLEHFL